MLPAMKTMFQAGLNGRLPVPSEKRFLIHLIVLLVYKGSNFGEYGAYEIHPKGD